MKEKVTATYVSVSICLSVALLRMLAPAMPFDWMTLVLVVAAAIFSALSLMYAKPQKSTPEVSYAPFSLPEMDALYPLMQQKTWQQSEGDLPDALLSLHEENPFVALCAARGVLAMLLKQCKPKEEDKATIALLMSALDTAAAAGQSQLDRATVDVLFTYAMRAMGHVKQN